MATITIPKKITPGQDLIAIPRTEYDALQKRKKPSEFVPTAAQKRALARAEENLVGGNTLSYHELVRKLGFTR